MQRVSRVHVWLYRATRGWIGARADHLDILLLTTRGRRSGKRRTTPLPWFADGEKRVCVGSNGARPGHAAWYHNILADPEVELQVRGRRMRARARIAEGEERERLWKAITAEQPRYADYQAQTERRIPVVVFDVAESGG